MNQHDMIFSEKPRRDELFIPSQPNPIKHSHHHHLSSFGLLNRNGLEVPPGISLSEPGEEKNKPGSEFSSWLPLQEQWGYIPMRKFDFW